MIKKHEPYSLDLLTYEIAQHLGDPDRLVRVRQGMKRACSKRNMTQIEKRGRRLQKYGMTVLMFAS